MTDDVQSHLGSLGLREHPFAPTADPAYFYATRAHQECLFHLWHTIDERQGIAVVLGDYGTGKTTLLRKLIVGMSARPDQYNTAVVGSPIPSWTSFALLESIVTQFGLRPPVRSLAGHMEALNRYLLENRARINTLVIDDAQNLNKHGQLELLRLVQNLETPQHKLLNLVLFAQMEWATVLRAVPNFRQRINVTYVLRRLDLAETRELVDFRLRMAGAGPGSLAFDDEAIRTVHAFAQGSPRVTMTVCRNAVLFARQLHTREIGSDLILHTIRKTMLPESDGRDRPMATAGGRRFPFSLTPPARPRPAPAPQGEPSGDEARGLTREERANQLLLRMARSRPAGDGESRRAR